MKVVPAWTSDAGYLTTWDRDAAPESAVGGLLRFGDDITEGVELDDAGHHVRGKEIPSGFTTCEYRASTEVSVDWVRSYECMAGPAPNEQAATSRFSELGATWRRCFESSGLREEPSSAGPQRRIDFRKPTRPSQRVACSLWNEGSLIRAACFYGEND